MFVENLIKLACCLIILLASGGQGHVGFKKGLPARIYALENKVLLNDVKGVKDKSVGYLISGDVQVGAIWQDDEGDTILKFKLSSPTLHIMSRKAPSPHDFVTHSSILESSSNDAFYAVWKRGEIDKVYFRENEPLGLVNLKKGIVSLFQFQVLDGERNETDVSGYCNVQYSSTSPLSTKKIKRNCINPLNPNLNHPERILSAVTSSKYDSQYTLSEDSSVMSIIYTREVHKMKLTAKQDAGNSIEVVQRLILYEDKTGEAETVQGATVKAAISEIIRSGENLKEQTLQVLKEPRQCQDKVCPSLTKLIKDNKDSLKSSTLGTIKSANVFIKLLNVARESKVDDILKALKSIRDKEVLQQVSDLVGFTQTLSSHQAAKKFFHFDSELDMDNIERYLWALSMGINPQEEIILDILKLSENKDPPKKLSETLILTACAMARNFAHNSDFGYKHKVVEKVMNSATYYLSICKDSECKVKYLRALKNLQHPKTTALILNEALTGQKVVSVAAIKSLKAMPRSYWDSSVIKTCQKILYQIPKRFDSSSRTLAADIILESRPSEDVIRELLNFLTKQEKEFEVKQFVYQRLLMIADRCPQFRQMLAKIVKPDKQLNNWHVLGQRGLTTAFSRGFMQNQWLNGSLVSIQEISGGVLKRGHVDVVIESDGEKKEIFSLGLFAGGLSNFMGGGGDEEPGEEAESSTAGMELTVQGVQVRPFTFFSGQGELMGHVWAGTASDKTTAFQTVSLLQDSSQWITLGNGVTAELSIMGAVSFDLSAQIQLSIWSRVAHSLVEKSAGIMIQGLLKADSSFVKSQVEFTLTSEPKLNLVSDLDFYSDVSLCMQLKQPDTTVKHNIFKVERIPGSKHKLRKSQYKVLQVPGKTYALNMKNNEMCNLIHNK